MTAASIDLSVVKHEVVRVTTSSPALLLKHLESLGATVVVPLLSSTTVRGGRAYTLEQASVDLPVVNGERLHLILAGEPVITSEAEYRAKAEARRATSTCDEFEFPPPHLRVSMADPIGDPFCARCGVVRREHSVSSRRAS